MRMMTLTPRATQRITTLCDRHQFMRNKRRKRGRQRKTERERERGERGRETKPYRLIKAEQSSAAQSAQWGQKGLTHLHISLSFAFDALLDLCLLHLSQL